MTVLEEVAKLASQGKNESQIIVELQQRGIPPKQINDAIEQFKIKNAVAGTAPNQQQNNALSQQEIQQPQYQQTPAQDYYSANIVPEQYPNEQQYPPQQTYNTSQQQAYSPEQYQYSQYQSYPQEQDYDYYGQDYQGYNSNSIIEIAEQVFSEQIKKSQKEIDELKEFKAIATAKIENISERLKKIESTIDKLQIEILEKVGSYGKNIEIIKKEISMVEDSFRKMTGQVAEKIAKKKSKK